MFESVFQYTTEWPIRCLSEHTRPLENPLQSCWEIFDPGLPGLPAIFSWLFLS